MKFMTPETTRRVPPTTELLARATPAELRPGPHTPNYPALTVTLTGITLWTAKLYTYKRRVMLDFCRAGPPASMNYSEKCLFASGGKKIWRRS